jgi:hypothetical protein
MSSGVGSAKAGPVANAPHKSRVGKIARIGE